MHTGGSAQVRRARQRSAGTDGGGKRSGRDGLPGDVRTAWTMAVALARITAVARAGLPFLFAAPPRLAFFDCAGVRLMLSTPEPAFDRPGSVLYFAVDDIHHARETLASRGVSFQSEPHKIATLADREVWLADFQDTEGNTLALMSEPRLS